MENRCNKVCVTHLENVVNKSFTNSSRPSPLRTLLDQTVAELKHQVALLKQREAKVSSENKELQHTILDLEARLNTLQDKAHSINQNTVNSIDPVSVLFSLSLPVLNC